MVKDRAANPSNYAIVAVSEGAQLQEGSVVEFGPEDPYGHRKLGGIGELIGDRLERLTGIGILNQKLSYLMRAGPPDAVDRMVAWMRQGPRRAHVERVDVTDEEPQGESGFRVR